MVAHQEWWARLCSSQPTCGLWYCITSHASHHMHHNSGSTWNNVFIFFNPKGWPASRSDAVFTSQPIGCDVISQPVRVVILCITSRSDVMHQKKHHNKHHNLWLWCDTRLQLTTTEGCGEVQVHEMSITSRSDVMRYEATSHMLHSSMWCTGVMHQNSAFWCFGVIPLRIWTRRVQVRCLHLTVNSQWKMLIFTPTGEAGWSHAQKCKSTAQPEGLSSTSSYKPTFGWLVLFTRPTTEGCGPYF